MNFTILSNPPYQDNNKAKNNKLWYKFIELDINLLQNGATMAKVTPSSFIGTTGFGKKFFQKCQTIYNLIQIDYTSDKYFTEGVSICSWILKKEPYKGVTKVIHETGIHYLDLRDGLPLFGEEKLLHAIFNKIANSNHPRIPLKIGQDIPKDEYCDDGKYEVYASGKNIKRTNVLPTTGDLLKFVVPYSCSYTDRFITNGYIGMLNSWCPIKDEEGGILLSTIFDIPLIKLFVENYKTTAGFAAAVKYAEVPLIKDFNDVHQQFDFTSEEIEYLRDKNVIQ